MDKKKIMEKTTAVLLSILTIIMNVPTVYANDNGDVLTNDVEMVLIGYSTNEKQYFVPSSNRNVSLAIRQSDIYYNESDNSFYKWNGTEMILYTGGN